MKITAASAITALLLPITIATQPHRGHYHGHGVFLLRLAHGDAPAVTAGPDTGVTRIHVIHEPSITKIVEQDGRAVKVAPKTQPDVKPKVKSTVSVLTEAVLQKIQAGIKHIQERIGELSRIYPHPSNGKPNSQCQTSNPIAHSNVSVVINDGTGKPREIVVTKTEAPAQPKTPQHPVAIAKPKPPPPTKMGILSSEVNSKDSDSEFEHGLELDEGKKKKGAKKLTSRPGSKRSSSKSSGSESSQSDDEKTKKKKAKDLRNKSDSDSGSESDKSDKKK